MGDRPFHCSASSQSDHAVSCRMPGRDNAGSCGTRPRTGRAECRPDRSFPGHRGCLNLFHSTTFADQGHRGSGRQSVPASRRTMAVIHSRGPAARADRSSRSDPIHRGSGGHSHRRAHRCLRSHNGCEDPATQGRKHPGSVAIVSPDSSGEASRNTVVGGRRPFGLGQAVAGAGRPQLWDPPGRRREADHRALDT